MMRSYMSGYLLGIGALIKSCRVIKMNRIRF